MSKTSKTSFVQKYANANNLKREVAKHDLVISVNRTDCKRGEKKNPENCAIARAIMAQRPEAKRVFIFRTRAVVETARRLVTYEMPDPVQREVEAYDRFGVMTPGLYRLKAPSPSRAPAAKKKENARRKRLPGVKPQERKLRHADAYRVGVKMEKE